VDPTIQQYEDLENDMKEQEYEHPANDEEHLALVKNQILFRNDNSSLTSSVCDKKLRNIVVEKIN